LGANTQTSARLAIFILDRINWIKKKKENKEDGTMNIHANCHEQRRIYHHIITIADLIYHLVLVFTKDHRTAGQIR
jgi:hypothetical protein